MPPPSPPRARRGSRGPTATCRARASRTDGTASRGGGRCRTKRDVFRGECGASRESFRASDPPAWTLGVDQYKASPV